MQAITQQREKRRMVGDLATEEEPVSASVVGVHHGGDQGAKVGEFDEN
jgi:hypothetical protein